MTRPAPPNDHNMIAADQLRSIVERIEALDDQIRDMNADKSDLYKEAKGNGYDVGAIRKVIARRRKGEAVVAEEEAIIELYMSAIEGKVRL
jgi:uncharacterized protein (UPF0335 family)